MPNTPPSPQLFFDTINAYQRTAALKSAIELDLFSAIARGHNTPAAIASRLPARPFVTANTMPTMSPASMISRKTIIRAPSIVVLYPYFADWLTLT